MSLSREIKDYREGGGCDMMADTLAMKEGKTQDEMVKERLLGLLDSDQDTLFHLKHILRRLIKEAL